MKVIVAKTAGFCFGVKRAVEAVERELREKEEPIYTYGPIIHNEEVVNELSRQGVHVINELSELDDLPKGTIVLRSHGVSKAVSDKMKEAGFQVVDAACPFVKRIHELVSKYTEEGFDIVIIGNAGHPEVEGIKSYGEEGRILVIGNEEEAEKLVLKNKTVVVAQTTANLTKFKDLVEIIQKKEYDGKGYGIVVVNTICSATKERQEEAAEISKKADAMIVIGGAESSNTRKLFEICKSLCPNTHYIQTKRDLHVHLLRNCDCIGITAGASTPTNIIEEVQKHVRNEF